MHTNTLYMSTMCTSYLANHVYELCMQIKRNIIQTRTRAKRNWRKKFNAKSYKLAHVPKEIGGKNSMQNHTKAYTCIEMAGKTQFKIIQTRTRA